MLLIEIQYVNFYYKDHQRRGFLFPKKYNYYTEDNSRLHPRRCYELSNHRIILIQSIQSVDKQVKNYESIPKAQIKKAQIGRELSNKLAKLKPSEYVLIKRGGNHDAKNNH